MAAWFYVQFDDVTAPHVYYSVNPEFRTATLHKKRLRFRIYKV